MLIWPIHVKFRRNIPRIMTNKSMSGNFYFQNIFPIVSNYTSHLACFKLLQLQMWISQQPIKISEKPDTLKGEVWSRKILPLLIELFHRNSKIIVVLSSLLCNYDNSALKLLLSTTFATRKTPSWIWRQLWRSNSQTLLFIALTWLTWSTFLTSISNEGLTMVNCLVVNCHNTYKNTKGKGVSFHKLPVNENLKKIWLAKIKREDALPKLESCYVCSDHFIKDDFKRNIQVWKLCFLTFASNLKLCLPFPYSNCIFFFNFI